MRAAIIPAVSALALLGADGAAAASTIKIEALSSSRADLVSGGTALVGVRLPRGADPARLRVRVGRRDVSRAFARRPSGRVEGLVGGLRNGRNVVVATLPGGRGARLEITNHPNGGPIFSGPQIQPWRCQETARDAQCNEPAEFSYRYKPTDGDELQPYDPEHPPTDVDTATTDTGATVPFIVRTETGYQDRDRYRIDVLYQPGRPWDRFDAQKQFNHKLLLTHGSNCDNAYEPSDPPGGDADAVRAALGSGYMVASTALADANANCNPALAAESLMMLKEHVVETYGDLRYAIGIGCSGGSLMVNWVANAYPGIYQGLITSCTFPDVGSTGQQILDYVLLANYFGITISGPGAPVTTQLGALLGGRGWTTAQAAAVAGDGTAHLPVSFNWTLSAYAYMPFAEPDVPCPGIGADEVYDPQTRPNGVRCGIVDWNVNLLGPRPASAWGPQERELSRGFAGLPVDNVGIQYGLQALEGGQISPTQFVDLNAQIGGLNIDFKPQPQRTVADAPALRNAYRSGLVNDTSNLDQVAIINHIGPNDPGVAHDTFRGFAIRARLDREHGTHANQVMWEGMQPMTGDPRYARQAFQAMDRWLAAIERDTSARPLAQKVIADKPADIHEQCSDGNGHKLSDDLCGDTLVPVYGTPRTVAGEAITTDQNKCRLEPLRRDDYGVTFTDEQWRTLEATFPTGVCDWSKPGVDQQAVVPWLTYTDARGKVIYGGRPLGPAPRSRACRTRGGARCQFRQSRRRSIGSWSSGRGGGRL